MDQTGRAPGRRRQPPRVLFLTHDASRTGAPIVLLHLMRWLARSSDVEMAVVAGRGGPMLPAFAEMAPTVALAPPRLVGAGIRRMPGGAHVDQAVQRSLARRHLARHGRFDLVYCNTVMNGALLPFVAHLPVITHVHEMQQWIDTRVEPDLMRTIVRCSDRLIAASDPVRQNLCERHGVDPSLVTTVEEFIDLRAVPVRPPRAAPGSHRVMRVGGAGTLDLRKGPDLFIEVAARMARRAGVDFRFTWIGGDLNGPTGRQVRARVAELGLADRVTFTGHVDDPLSRLAELDLFLLTSREDPFPLVMLEAAAMEVPIVCFAQSGGAPGFVEDDAGVVVPHLDVDAMAQAAVGLAASPVGMSVAGRRAAEKVRARSDVEVAGPRILDLINTTVAGVALAG